MQETWNRSLSHVFVSFRDVFSRPWYFVLALGVAFGIILLTVILMNYQLLAYVFSEATITSVQTIRFLVTMLGSFRTNLSLAQQVITIVIAVLSGVDIAVLVYLLKARIALGATGASVLGIVGSFLGIGCASCGSVILTSVLGFTLATGVIGVLPLRGLEFGIVGIFILLWSIYLIAKKIGEPLVC